MNILPHTLDWYRGEIFEGFVTLGSALLLLLLAALLCQMGSSPAAQVLVIPLLVSAVIIGGASGYNTWLHKQRAVELRQSPPEDKIRFAQEEMARLEGFQYLYTLTKYLAAFLFGSALLIFFFVENKQWQAVAIAMLILGLSCLVIDYFSKARAEEYYEVILQQINGWEQ